MMKQPFGKPKGCFFLDYFVNGLYICPCYSKYLENTAAIRLKKACSLRLAPTAAVSCRLGGGGRQI